MGKRAARPYSGPVFRDPDDDLVLATALAAQADLIVSRDKHLRNLKQFHRIPILDAADALARIEQRQNDSAAKI